MMFIKGHRHPLCLLKAGDDAQEEEEEEEDVAPWERRSRAHVGLSF